MHNRNIVKVRITDVTYYLQNAKFFLNQRDVWRCIISLWSVKAYIKEAIKCLCISRCNKSWWDKDNLIKDPNRRFNDITGELEEGEGVNEVVIPKRGRTGRKGLR